MKILLAEICIWILRKLQISCIIGMKLHDGIISGLNRETYWYDCYFKNVKTLDQNGESLNIESKRSFYQKSFKKEQGINV